MFKLSFAYSFLNLEKYEESVDSDNFTIPIISLVIVSYAGSKIVYLLTYLQYYIQNSNADTMISNDRISIRDHRMVIAAMKMINWKKEEWRENIQNLILKILCKKSYECKSYILKWCYHLSKYHFIISNSHCTEIIFPTFVMHEGALIPFILLASIYWQYIHRSIHINGWNWFQREKSCKFITFCHN